MSGTRLKALEALACDPPDVAAATEALMSINEQDLTPDALTLRNSLIEAANWIENGKARSYEIAQYLRNAADGRLPELDDHDIDLDLPEDGDMSSAFAGVAFAPRPGVPSLPGPDALLLVSMRKRDSLVARRIAGDTPSDSDIDAYKASLVELGRALKPFVDAEDFEGTDTGI